MKSIILIATMLLTFGMANAQIADVSQNGGYIKVYDDNNSKISSMYCSGWDVVGVTSTFFVIQKGGYIRVYDKNCSKISQMYCSNCQVKGAAGSSFTTKQGSYIKVYDKNCSKKSSRWE